MLQRRFPVDQLSKHHAPVDRVRSARTAAAIAVLAMLAMVLSLRYAQAAAAGHPQVVHIESFSLDRPLAVGRTSTLEVTLGILHGWHINSDHPLTEDSIPTRVAITVPAGVTAGAASYPTPQIVNLGFTTGERFSVFTDSARIRVPLTPSSDFKPQASEPGTLTVDYQACNNNECLRPTSISKAFDFAGLTAAAADRKSAGIVNDQAAESAPGASTLAKVFGSHGYFLGFLLVLLGGLALNLTPCVYPLIGVTVAYFGNQSGTHRKVAMLAAVYVLGIALMFSSVGVAVALSGGLFGAALQNVYVLTAIAAVMVLLALSSFGVFVLQAPQWMMRWAGVSRPGFLGALLMGFGMGVVAAPCIGPIVLGLLLMVERSGSPLFGFALFFTLAVGLGLPYIGLAMAAGSIRRLPRSGEWLRWTEQLFGFVLIGLALYFLEPVVPGHIINRVLPFYAAGAGIYLGFVSSAGRNWRPFLVFRIGVGMVAIAGLVYAAVPRTPRSMVHFAPFNEGALASARADGKPVVVDFSADWCIPCREMEQTTFVNPAVIRAASHFVRLRADLTDQNAANERLVHHFGVQGVPTTLFIDSAGQIRKREVGYVGPQQFIKDLGTVD
ncbi:MAG TPA: cytochrome c biogenesis protein CcdA [Candidatus Binataceae bacterium]|nr:cytochrome c biogenesis protein CcdA [Candidatus Binataceae bacterium]